MKSARAAMSCDSVLHGRDPRYLLKIPVPGSTPSILNRNLC